MIFDLNGGNSAAAKETSFRGKSKARHFKAFLTRGQTLIKFMADISLGESYMSYALNFFIEYLVGQAKFTS